MNYAESEEKGRILKNDFINRGPVTYHYFILKIDFKKYIFSKTLINIQVM